MAQAEHLEESSALASRIQEELAEVTGSEGRGVKQAPFRVLVGAAMPAVLVEVAFISNPEEEKLLDSDAYQTKVAAALVRGIARYRAASGPGRGQRSRAAGQLTGAAVSPRRAERPGRPLSLVAPARRWCRSPRRAGRACCAGRWPAGGAARERAGEAAPSRARGGREGAERHDQRQALLRGRATARACVIEERTVSFSNDLSRQLRMVVEELVRGSQHRPPAHPRPRARSVLEVFVTARGMAYVDLSKEAATPPGAGSDDELLTVYSVVNSLTANFPAVKRVQILIEDRPVPTLAGHVDLSRPLPPDLTYLASATLTPAASPGRPRRPRLPPARRRPRERPPLGQGRRASRSPSSAR